MNPHPLIGRLVVASIFACHLLAGLPPSAHAGNSPYGWGSVPPIPLAEEVRDLVDAEGNDSTYVGVRLDGRVIAWGSNLHGIPGGVPHGLRAAAAPGAPKPIQVALGNSHAAVLLNDGSVRIWGSGPPETMSVPVELATAPAPGVPKAVEIEAGSFHTVVRMNDGSLRAWGAATSLSGFSTFSSAPTPGMPMPVALACGGYTTGILYDDGSVQGFGMYGALWARPAPFPGQAKAVAIAALNIFASDQGAILTMDDGTVEALGVSMGLRSWAREVTGAVEAIPCYYGILFRRADGTLGTSGFIAGVSDISGPVAGLGYDGFSPLVRMVDGSVRHVGQLSLSLAEGKPVHVGGKNIKDVAIGSGRTITLDSTGKLAVLDSYFPLNPPLAEAATVFTDVAIGDRSFTGSADPVVLAARADATVAAWGADYGGLITSMPSGLANVKALSTGHEFAVAVRHDGTVVAWGNRAAANGLDSGAALLTGVDTVATGASHALARHTDGTVSAWGNNASGAATVPPGLTGVLAVAVSTSSSFALKSDGSVVAWGPATSPGGSFAVPANLAVSPASGNPRAVGIAAGHEHAVVCFDDGSVQAWGYNNAGNLNTPPGTSRPVRAVHAGAHVTVALVEETPVVRLIAVEARESVWPTVLEFRLDYPAESAINIDYTFGGSATFGVDYTAAASSGTVTIPMGATSALLPISVIDDYVPEPDENFIITLSHEATAVVLFEGNVAFGILNDDTDPPVVSVSDLRVDEEGGAAAISVALDRAASAAVNVNFSLGGGSGLSGSDWSAPAASGTLIIPAGALSTTIPFTALGDSLVEGDETFTVTLSAPVNAVLGGGIATVTLTDNDIAPPQVSAGAVSVNEGNRSAFVPVVLNRAASDDVTLFFRTLAGSALPGRDYFTRVGSILIPAGETTATIALQILENNVAGRDLAFDLQLTALIGPAEISGGPSTITILDNDRLAMPPWGGIPMVWGDDAPVISSPAPFLKKISAGASHVIGLRQDGTLVGWGPVPVPSGVTDAVDVAAGWSSSLALRADGTVAGGGGGLTNVTAISVGRFHALALHSDGRVSAWGSNAQGQCAVPLDLPPVVAISAGELHSMVLTNGGQVVCWGSNLENESIVPPGLGPCTAIAAGNLRSLAVGIDGQVHYWGYNLAGSAVPAPYNAPAAPGAPRIIQANVMGDHIILLKEDGTVASWGNLAAHNQQVPAGLPYAFQISGGQFFSAALVESLSRPSVVLLEDAEAAEGLTAVFGQVRLETIAATNITVTLAIEPGTARAPEDFPPHDLERDHTGG